MKRPQARAEAGRRRPATAGGMPDDAAARVRQIVSAVREHPTEAMVAALTGLPHETMLKVMAYSLCQAAGVDEEERRIHDARVGQVLEQWVAVLATEGVSPQLLSYLIARLLHMLAEGCKRAQKEQFE